MFGWEDNQTQFLVPLGFHFDDPDSREEMCEGIVVHVRTIQEDAVTAKVRVELYPEDRTYSINLLPDTPTGTSGGMIHIDFEFPDNNQVLLCEEQVIKEIRRQVGEHWMRVD